MADDDNGVNQLYSSYTGIARQDWILLERKGIRANWLYSF